MLMDQLKYTFGVPKIFFVYTSSKGQLMFEAEWGGRIKPGVAPPTSQLESLWAVARQPVQTPSVWRTCCWLHCSRTALHWFYHNRNHNRLFLFPSAATTNTRRRLIGWRLRRGTAPRWRSSVGPDWACSPKPSSARTRLLTLIYRVSPRAQVIMYTCILTSFRQSLPSVTQRLVQWKCCCLCVGLTRVTRRWE